MLSLAQLPPPLRNIAMSYLEIYLAVGLELMLDRKLQSAGSSANLVASALEDDVVKASRLYLTSTVSDVTDVLAQLERQQQRQQMYGTDSGGESFYPPAVSADAWTKTGKLVKFVSQISEFFENDRISGLQIDNNIADLQEQLARDGMGGENESEHSGDEGPEDMEEEFVRQTDGEVLGRRDGKLLRRGANLAALEQYEVGGFHVLLTIYISCLQRLS